MTSNRPEETSDSEYIICPHCSEKMGDCWEWVSDHVSETTCDYCKKPIEVWAEHYVDYCARATQSPVDEGGR